MSDLNKLSEIKKHLALATGLLQDLIDTSETAKANRPPPPGAYQRVDRTLWKYWENFPAGEFTAAQLKQAIGLKDAYLKSRTNASFTTALLRWERTGFIRITEKGVGTRPTVYAKTKM